MQCELSLDNRMGKVISSEEMAMGVNMAKGPDKTVYLTLDIDLLSEIYWASIPQNEKQKIKIGDKHDGTKFPIKSS
jgi:hypothetical protein